MEPTRADYLSTPKDVILFAGDHEQTRIKCQDERAAKAYQVQISKTRAKMAEDEAKSDEEVFRATRYKHDSALYSLSIRREGSEVVIDNGMAKPTYVEGFGEAF